MNKGVLQWLESPRLPGDFYELLGRSRFDGDRAGLENAIRAANADLFPYQQVQGEIFHRAQNLMTELGNALGMLSNPSQLDIYHHALWQRLYDEWSNSPPSSPREWLTSKGNVHPSALGWGERVFAAQGKARGVPRDLVASEPRLAPTTETANLPAADSAAKEPGKSSGKTPKISGKKRRSGSQNAVPAISAVESARSQPVQAVETSLETDAPSEKAAAQPIPTVTMVASILVAVAILAGVGITVLTIRSNRRLAQTNSEALASTTDQNEADATASDALAGENPNDQNDLTNGNPQDTQSLLSSGNAPGLMAHPLAKCRAGTALAVGFDHQRVAVGARDGRVLLTSLGRQADSRWFATPGTGITRVAWSEDGSRVLAATSEGTVVLLELATGTPLGIHAAHGQSIVGMAFRGKKYPLVIWSHELRFHQFSLAKDASYALDTPATSGTVLGETLAVTGHGDGRVRVWSLSTGLCVSSATGHSALVHLMACSARGQHLLTGDTSGLVILWGLASDGSLLEQRRWTLASRARTLAFARQDRLLLVGDADGTVVGWDAGHGGELLRMSPGREHTQTLSAMDFSRDGKNVLLATSDRVIVQPLPEVALSGSSLATAVAAKPTPPPANKPPKTKMRAVAATLSADGEKRLFSSEDPFLYYHRNGRPTTKLEGHTAPAKQLAFSPRHGWAATGDEDGLIILWEIAQGSFISRGPLTHAEDGISALEFAPHPHLLLEADFQGGLRLWNVSTRQRLWQQVFDEPVQALDVSQNGLYALCSTEQTVYVVDMGNGTRLWQAICHFPITSVAFAHDGQRLLAGGVNHLTHWNWRVAGNSAESTIVAGKIAAFSPQGRFAILVAADEQTLSMYDTSNSVIKWRSPMPRDPNDPHLGNVLRVGFAPAGFILYVCYDSGRFATFQTERFPANLGRDLENAVHAPAPAVAAANQPTPPRTNTPAAGIGADPKRTPPGKHATAEERFRYSLEGKLYQKSGFYLVELVETSRFREPVPPPNFGGFPGPVEPFGADPFGGAGPGMGVSRRGRTTRTSTTSSTNKQFFVGDREQALQVITQWMQPVLTSNGSVRNSMSLSKRYESKWYADQNSAEAERLRRIDVYNRSQRNR